MAPIVRHTGKSRNKEITISLDLKRYPGSSTESVFVSVENNIIDYSIAPAVEPSGVIEELLVGLRVEPQYVSHLHHCNLREVGMVQREHKLFEVVTRSAVLLQWAPSYGETKITRRIGRTRECVERRCTETLQAGQGYCKILLGVSTKDRHTNQALAVSAVAPLLIIAALSS